jgi:hypothetical protein
MHIRDTEVKLKTVGRVNCQLRNERIAGQRLQPPKAVIFLSRATATFVRPV